MEKTRIKEILREGFKTNIQEEVDSKVKYEKDYTFVQTKLKDTMLKMNQVMGKAGLGNPKDATDRSLFSKKVHKEKNSEGGQYLFDEKELASVVKVLSNPASYLGAK
jgi:hypothetical protein